jgi:hypothetical protein
MRRKLISLDAFDRIESDSLSRAEFELSEASSLLAQTLGTGPLSFGFFDDDKVVYETDNGTFVHAKYTLNESSVTFDDITELVIDTESQKKRLRECVSKMVEAIIDGNNTEADLQFGRYMEMFTAARRSGAVQDIAEEVVVRADNRSGKVKKWTGSNIAKKKAAEKLWRTKRGEMVAKRRKRNLPSRKAEEMRQHKKNQQKGVFRKVSLIRTGKSERAMKEWNQLSTHIAEYVTLLEHGSWLGHTAVKTTPAGDVTSVTLPTSQARNEGKILSLQYKTLKTDVKVLREAARGLIHNEEFVKAVALMKRLNNMSMANEFQESINTLVATFPNVLYLTQPELAKVLGKALDQAGQMNYDDESCNFMAEGILRVAADTFSERVTRLTSLANGQIKEGEDAYAQFQQIVSDFFPKLDESLATEMQVFTDLYNTLVDVRRLALESNNGLVRDEATAFLEELKAVVEGVKSPELDLAAEVAEWLQELVEANLPDTSEEMKVSNSPHDTVVGDHPDMAKKAKQPGIPGNYTGDWGDSAPVSDGKSYKGKEADEMRNHGWGNKGGKDVYPTLSNPYVPKPFGDYTMKGEPGVDKNSASGFSQIQGNTWPELTNPYVPKEAGGPGGKGYKAKTDNLIVDK